MTDDHLIIYSSQDIKKPSLRINIRNNILELLCKDNESTIKIGEVNLKEKAEVVTIKPLLDLTKLNVLNCRKLYTGIKININDKLSPKYFLKLPMS